MDIFIVNDKLIILSYRQDKEYLIKKNIGAFIRIFFSADSRLYKIIKSRLGKKQTGHRKIIGHKFSLVYSENRYVNYSNLEAVKQIEKKATERHKIYKDAFLNDKETGDYYFLNPILFKKIKTNEYFLGSLLYFSSGIKCSAKFNSQPHIKKFIPSNGARYPYFPIIYINNCEGIAAGVYKYHSYFHSLIYTKDKVYSKNFDVRIVFKAEIERVMSRYPNGIAYQDILFDLGHLITTLRKCLAHYGINYTLTTYINDKPALNIMALEMLAIDLKFST